MRAIILVTASGLILASAAFAREQPLLARVTVYWASGEGGSDTCTRQHECATGKRLRAGHCGVDPEKIPYGSKVVFPDAICVAVDTGRDVISRKAARRCGRNAAERRAPVIDRFFETKRQALSWVSAHPHFMTVRVLSPGQDTESESLQPSQALKDKTAQTKFAADDVSQNNLIAESSNCVGLQLSPALLIIRSK